MINVTITKEYVHETQTIVDIEIQGHANSDVYGKDLVCAGVSTIAYGFMNYLNHLYSNQVMKIRDEKGDIELKFYYYDNDEKMKGALNLFTITIDTLVANYEEYIGLETHHVWGNKQ